MEKNNIQPFKKNANIKQNFVMQFIYQILIFAVPLLVFPYLTRVLGKTNLGIYTFSNSIAYYFVLFANLGISNYGQRLIASNKDNELKLRKSFWSLYIDHLIVSIASFILYILFFGLINKVDNEVYLIQSLYVLSALFDVTWLFYGLENLKNIVIKNTLVKVLECICIFCFVKSDNDLNIYTIIMSVSTLVGQLIVIPSMLRIVKPIKVDWKDLKPHFKQLVVLFVSILASTLYSVFDKTLIGLIVSKEDAAFYEYANKIINIPKQLLFVVGTIIFPRACSCYARGEFERQKKYLDDSLFIIIFLSIGCVFGLMATGQKLAQVYYGNDFLESGKLIVCIVPIITIISIGDIMRLGYLLPAHKDFQVTISVIIGALLNLLISIPLLFLCGTIGAVIGTALAELTVTFIQIRWSKDITNFKDIIKKILPFIICGCAMYIIVKIIDVNSSISIGALIFEIFSGATIYFILSTITCLLFNRKYVISLIKKLRKKKRN